MDWKRYVKDRMPPMALHPVRESEIAEELAALLEDTYDEARKAGHSHLEAFARAAGQLPNAPGLAKWIEKAEKPVVSRLPASMRGDRLERRLIRSRMGIAMHTLLQDVRYAVRIMAKSPSFTALSVAVLALGIGANSAIFSMSYALLEKAVAVPDTKNLCVAEEYRLNQPLFDGTSPALLSDWKSQSVSFDGWAATQWYDTNISGEGTPERVQGFRVSAGFFDVLHANPLYGRTFRRGEDAPGHDRVVVLGFGLWKRRFGADPATIGKMVRLEGQPYEIIGVMPKEFDYPVSAELWMPLSLTPEESVSRTDRSLTVVARLKPGKTIKEGGAELAAITARMARLYPEQCRGWGARTMAIREEVSGNMTRQYMSMLMGAVAFVLLIAIANVSNLQLARATGRAREVALRLALGAGRWRVMRQLLTETTLQSLVAMGLGMILAYWSLQLIRRNFPPAVLKYVPGITVMGLDWATLVYSFALAILAGGMAGLLPALNISRPNLSRTLREGGRGTSAGRGRHLARGVLIVAEVSIALVLLVGAGLMVNGLGTIRNIHDSIHPESVLIFNVNLPDVGYRDMPPRILFYREVLDRLANLPGVESAALGRSVPYADSMSIGAISLEGRPVSTGELRRAQYQYVNEGWFRLFRIPLIEGRLPSEQDGMGTPRVVAISDRLAQTYWPGTNPLGKRIKLGLDSSQESWMTIVGVVGNIDYNWFERTPTPVVYLPYRQTTRQIMQFAVRAKGDPLTLTEPIRKQVAAVDPDMPIFDVKTHAQMIQESVTGISYVAAMMTVLGVIALVLASAGLYGVMAYAVTERTHEIGVRIALGAERRTVLQLVLRRGLVLTLIGLVIGAALSYALARLLSSLIVGVSATDISTFGEVVSLLALVAFAAAYIPARRAMQVDPLTALRYE